jgi:glycosyltransferase involved in cell wall biosynthesis
MVNKRVLMIAYHYPPIQGSSGVLRTLKFTRYLHEYGWEPAVLTIHPRAYPAVNDHQLKEIPEGMRIERAFGLDTAKHLAYKGRYIAAMALPDRWATWWYGGVWAGRRMIREFRPDLIWSTYPIATAHRIGHSLARWSGLPWIADFRDSMTEDNYPPDPTQRAIYRRIEAQTVRTCRVATFTAPSAVRMYAERYPDLPADRWKLIHNGYDEENFKTAQSAPIAPVAGRPVTLLHAGILYPSERDPRPFFAALAQLKQQQGLNGEQLRIVLRATQHDNDYRPIIQQHNLSDIVQLEPALPYEAALQEMMNADGLLLFQAANCNHQIPAKLYEYLRAHRPILALTDAQGDTCATLREAGVTDIIPLDKADIIAHALPDFITKIRAGTAAGVSSAACAPYSRRAQTQTLAKLFDTLVT